MSPTFIDRRWHLPSHAAEVMAIFGFPAGADCSSDLWWRTNDSGDIDLYAMCSDTFAWGTADCEPITEADMPLLRQCLDDLRAVGGTAEVHLSTLYAARKRHTTPMDAFLAGISDVAIMRLYRYIDEKDLRVDVYSNNTGVVAARITHMPTGVTVTGDNKRDAMEKIQEALRVHPEQTAEVDDERAIPSDVIDGLLGILKPEAWAAWMDMRMESLGDRTPWECIDADDKDAVLQVLASYRDTSFS